MGSPNNPCACGSGLSYMVCCHPIHNSHAMATTAEALMRSRYTAFTKAMGDYLINTQHKSTRKPKEKSEIVSWARSVNWIRLEVLSSTKGTDNDIEGTVSFAAYFYECGQVQVIKENSYFVKENGYWYYVGPVSI
ncbi:MAG: YchJ family protein [Flavicella sp.]